MRDVDMGGNFLHLRWNQALWTRRKCYLFPKREVSSYRWSRQVLLIYFKISVAPRLTPSTAAKTSSLKVWASVLLDRTTKGFSEEMFLPFFPMQMLLRPHSTKLLKRSWKDQTPVAHSRGQFQKNLGIDSLIFFFPLLSFLTAPWDHMVNKSPA